MAATWGVTPAGAPAAAVSPQHGTAAESTQKPARINSGTRGNAFAWPLTPTSHKDKHARYEAHCHMRRVAMVG